MRHALVDEALRFDDEVQRVVRSLAVVHEHDEVGQVLADVRTEPVGHFEPQVVVLRVGDHLRMRLGDAAELALPAAVEHDPVDVVLRGRAVRVPSIGPGRIEPDEPG
jgi:hypothetical protein